MLDARLPPIPANAAIGLEYRLEDGSTGRALRIAPDGTVFEFGDPVGPPIPAHDVEQIREFGRSETLRTMEAPGSHYVVSFTLPDGVLFRAITWPEAEPGGRATSGPSRLIHAILNAVDGVRLRFEQEQAQPVRAETVGDPGAQAVLAYAEGNVMSGHLCVYVHADGRARSERVEHRFPAPPPQAVIREGQIPGDLVRSLFQPLQETWEWGDDPDVGPVGSRNPKVAVTLTSNGVTRSRVISLMRDPLGRLLPDRFRRVARFLDEASRGSPASGQA